MTVTTQTQEGVTVIKTTNSPTMGSSKFTVTFEQYEKVVQAAVFLENPITADRAFATTTSLSGNAVEVTIKQTTISDDTPDPTWENVVTNDVAGEDIVVIADCI